MAKYKISHPQLPQLRGILHLPEGVQPNDKHFWEAAKTMVRPYGASQLTDKSKIIAYRNGFFDSPSTPIFDQEDDPNTLQSEEQQGILSSLMDLTKEGLRRVSTGSSPHEKVNLLGSKLDIYNRKIIPQDYSTDNFSEQLKEAGKITFGNLDNMVPITKVDDVVARSLKRVGLKPTKSNRAKAIKAARDYSEGNIKASLGMGVVRAQQTGQFVKEGLPYLTNKMLMDEADDSDVLDTVNTSISFDKLMYESENAAKLAAFAMDNPLESIKASASGVVGGVVQSSPLGSTLGVDSKSIQDKISNKDSLSFDSQLQQDLSTGFQEPSEGLSLLTEVVADPLNLAGAPVAKAVTSPLRIGLKGRMLKTITDVQKNTTRLAQLQTVLKKLPEGARVTQGIVKGQIVKVTEELAEQQKILQKYGSNSLTLRLAGQASPETLGKVAMDTFDQSTEAGMIGMGLVREATKASDKMSKLRRVANVAAKYNPEIAGATVGAMIAGPGGAVVGAALPSLIKALRVLSAMPENMAIRSIITANKNAGMEISEQVARQRYKSGMNQLSGFLGVTSATGFALDQDSLGGGAGIAALTTFLGPKTLSLVDNITRDARVIGSELTLARTGDHTPFFRRLAMLPTPDEGLIGANTDKFNILMRAAPEGFFARKVDAVVQGFKASKIDASPSPQAFRRGPQGEAIGQAPTISGATRSVANFLDKPGAVGRLGTPIEVLGRFSKGMAAGASIPTTIGYIASGGQASGAIAGVAMSAPFTALGSGAGMYQNYKTKGDLYAKQIGDVQYYREHLTKPEQAEFDALPANIRAQIAGYSLSHPDVVFKQTTQGEGGFDPVNMEVTYNPNGTGYLKGTMAHEITHFMEIHGLTPMVNRILFGDELTGMAGEFASYDSDGKIVYTDEFIKLRDIYMDKLRKDVSLDSQEAIDAVTAYESDPKLIGREIFADQGADFLLSGKREKALNQGPFGKLVGATIDGITGVSFLRDFLLKLNLPLNSEGKFITSTGLFDGKLRKIPELQNLIEKYYKDVRGLKKAQIEGEKVTDPLTKRTRETKGARPIDDEFDTLYTVEDQKDPNVVDRLNTGGIFKTNPTTGEVERDSLKNPIRMTKGEADDISQAAGDHAAKVFEKNGIEVEINDKGRPFVKDLGALTEDIIDQLAKGPIHPRQIAALREISRALRQGDGERAGMLLGYYAATQGRKPKAVSFAIRTTMPYGFELTAQGNILVRLHDNKQIQRNLKFLKGELQAKKLPDELVGMYDDLFGNDNAVWDAFETYRNNTSNGIDGRTGLDPDPVKADKKLNFLNALHGGIDKAHVAKNPVLSAIGWKMAGINQKRSPFGPATKTFRLDRIFDAKRSGTASGFNLERAKNLMAPQGQKLMMPQMELDFSPPKATQSLESKPNFWKIYRINPKGPKVYDEVADVLIQVGSPWMDGSIAESQAGKLRLDQNKLLDAMGRAHRRADRGGGKMFMPSDDRPLGLPDNIRDEVLPGIKQDKFSRGQLEAALLKSGGSKAYAEEIGLMDWLKDRKSVTKSEVEQFVKENAPRLEEENSIGGEPKFSDYQEPGGTNYREVLIKLPKNSANTSEIQALKQEAQSILEKRQALEAEGKYWDSNALSPEIGAINARIRKLQSQDNFKDPHFNEDNVLLHLRLNDRIDVDGKKVLFIEELQSDWHQKGRKEGYASKFDNLPDTVPDAPFKKNWPALGLKRAIKEALEGGYDRIAWLDGEGHAARYDLSRQVDAIEVIRDGDGTYEIMARPADEMGGEFLTLETKIPKEKLADYIGKEPAKKALEKMEDGLAHLEGLDLKVGGEGMKSFYDRELVSVANKISKKIGGGKVRRETRLEAELDSQEFGSHVLDLPKNPQAVENLRLFMPAEKAPSDSSPPAILRDKQFMPAAYHGTPHTFKAEEGAPLGKFKSSQIGTGEGAQAYGHGLYFAGKREVAEHYKDMLTRQHGVKYPDGVYEKYSPLLDKAQDDVIKAQEAYDEAASNFITDENIGELTIRTEFPPEAVIKKLESEVDKAQKQLDKLNEELLSKSLNKGSLYKVELAPKENEYLLWDKPLSEQPKGVKEKLKKFLREQDGEDLWDYRKDMDYRELRDNVLENMPEPEISRRLKEAGIPGIKYLDGASRGKGKGDFNYVIFDEADVAITEKLFMPASEAGASKGKQAEAAKLWNEKGVESPYFKNWFGKSKVVDENGEPLVVYHGTPGGEFNVFDYDRIGNLGRMEGQGFYFATDKGMAQSYMGKDGRLMEVYLDIEKPMSVKQKGFDADTLETLLMEIAEEQHKYDPEVPIDEGFLADYGGLYDAVDLISKNETALDQLGDLMGAGVNAEFINIALKKVTGFDGVKAKITDKANDFASDIYVAFSPEQIKSATGNRGTFDAGERNINYMPSDPKALKAQPTNRVQQQSRSMPANRFMAPASMAKGELSERFR
jgi:bifunctional DNA-binding transcriptional regulator/antitoxin component of YhaV-PrlF toxin-antitoxin module